MSFYLINVSRKDNMDGEYFLADEKDYTKNQAESEIYKSFLPSCWEIKELLEFDTITEANSYFDGWVWL